MDIIQRDNRYYLQLANGELELTEQQAKKRVERGDKLRDYLQKLETREQPTAPENVSKSAQSFISSGKYFDNLIREFEQIFKYSDDKKEAAENLTRFCRNAITKLHHDRRNPKSDHVVIDYYILSWSRVISFLQSLARKEPDEEPIIVAPPTSTALAPQPRNLTRQLLIIQLLQADGLFPISDALQGINQKDIISLLSGMLHADKDAVKAAIQSSSAILLKRGLDDGENMEQRIEMLKEMEKYFEQLPYSNIISRIKLLIKIYYEMAAEK